MRVDEIVMQERSRLEDSSMRGEVRRILISLSRQERELYNALFGDRLPPQAKAAVHEEHEGARR